MTGAKAISKCSSNIYVQNLTFYTFTHNFIITFSNLKVFEAKLRYAATAAWSQCEKRFLLASINATQGMRTLSQHANKSLCAK